MKIFYMEDEIKQENDIEMPSFYLVSVVYDLSKENSCFLELTFQTHFLLY